MQNATVFLGILITQRIEIIILWAWYLDKNSGFAVLYLEYDF
jgi:hypothetical protein